MWQHGHRLKRSAVSESMRAVEDGADDARREMRAHVPVALIRCRSRVGVVAVHLTGMVAGARGMAWPWPRLARRPNWTGPGRGGPGGQPPARGPSQPPLRGAVRVRVLRRRRPVGQCLAWPGAPYLFI